MLAVAGGVQDGLEVLAQGAEFGGGEVVGVVGEVVGGVQDGDHGVHQVVEAEHLGADVAPAEHGEVAALLGPFEEHREQAHPAGADEGLGPQDGDAQAVGAVAFGDLLGGGLGAAVGVDGFAGVGLGGRDAAGQAVDGGGGDVHHAGGAGGAGGGEDGAGAVDDDGADLLVRVAGECGGGVDQDVGAVQGPVEGGAVADVADHLDAGAGAQVDAADVVAVGGEAFGEA